MQRQLSATPILTRASLEPPSNYYASLLPMAKPKPCAEKHSEYDAPLEGLKRQRADEPSRADHPAKRSRSEASPWIYPPPPEFWDRLSEIPLIRNAVKELDRRTSVRPLVPPPPTFAVPIRELATGPTKELSRFARHGGPDLCDLRGCRRASNGQRANSWAATRRATRSTKSSNATTVSASTTKTKSSKSPYNRGFEQHLADHAIHHVKMSEKPANLDTIRTALRASRRSLSPSTFTATEFEAYEEAEIGTMDEGDVLHNVIPTIMGSSQQGHIYARKTRCTNLQPLTDGTIVPPFPYEYYGALPGALDRSIREEIGSHVIPSTTDGKPIAPNFFLETKGPRGSQFLAILQSRYNGAMGTRAMHSLQNYGTVGSQTYDMNAYTLSSIYLGGGAGVLQLFAHHITAPTAPGAEPEYHTTQVGSYSLMGSHRYFLDGVTAFRNARDWARDRRDSFIQAANTRARRPSQKNPTNKSEVQGEQVSSPDEFVDCKDTPTLRNTAGDSSIPDPQQDLVDSAPQNSNEEHKSSSHSSGSSDSDEDPLSESFATNFSWHCD